MGLNYAREVCFTYLSDNDHEQCFLFAGGRELRLVARSPDFKMSSALRVTLNAESVTKAQTLGYYREVADAKAQTWSCGEVADTDAQTSSYGEVADSEAQIWSGGEVADTKAQTCNQPAADTMWKQLGSKEVGSHTRAGTSL